MDLYFLKNFPSYAATTAADLASLATALADPTTSANLTTINKVTGKIKALTQADTGEPLNLYFYDDGSTVSSWATNPLATLAVGLGDADPHLGDTYASTTSFSISGNARVGTLALNTTALRDRLSGSINDHRRLLHRQPSAGFILHVRKTSGGVTETMGRITITVNAGVLSQAVADYTFQPSVMVGAVVPLNDVTSLTGGGSTTLDGQVTANGAILTGTVVLLSYGRVGQFWKLIAGTDAESVATGVVRPDDYHASTNARIWVQL